MTDAEKTERLPMPDNPENEMSEVEGPEGKKPSANRAKTIIAVACTVAVVAAAGGVAFATSNQSQPEMPKTQSIGTTNREASSDTEGNENTSEGKKVLAFKIDMFVDANEKTTPVICHIVGTEDEGEKAVDFWHAEKLKKAGDNWGVDSKVKLENGDYKITEVVTPINEDGSIYNIEVKDGNVAKEPEKVKAEDVTQDQLDQLMDKVQEAVKNGDETLSEDAGKQVVEDVSNNIAANPNADKDKVKGKANEAKENADSEPSAPNKDNSSDPGTSSNNATLSKPTSNGNSGGGSSGNSTPNPTPAPTPKPEPVWVEEQGHWVDNWVTREVSPAVTGHAWRFSDGYIAYTREEHHAYSKQTGLSYTSIEVVIQEAQYETYNDRQWVVDVPAHWE